ncbi:MAG TPA: adenylosuccinate synthetase [Gemmataceae bacterium]|nr:adenylosuccinate synthetase [Gemmataceae bacterium]
MKRAIITVGLGFGDEGKGATVDFLCRRYEADLVVRYCGGSQAGHNVQLPDGRRHTFSQFGAGTLAGVPTYLGPAVVIHPTALAREADHLKELGVADPYSLLAVHPGCLVSTYLHQTANQLRELARGEARHGSCGHGIGETRSYWLKCGADAVCARDLGDRATLRAKLELLRQRLLLDVQEVLGRVPRDILAEYGLLGLTADAVAGPLLEVGKSLRLRDEMPDHTTAVYEGAQGVLLDEWYGFHPYTTWSTVTPHHALELAVASGADEVCVLGLTRAYTTRHGAGPFPSHDEAFTTAIRDEGNPWNRWQGDLRAGWLDLVLLRYAARACGTVDNLGVSCVDHLDGKDARVCVAHDNCAELPLPPGPDLAHQEQLTRTLTAAVAVSQPATKDALLGALGELAPVALVSHGPTHLDREGPPLHFRRRVVPEGETPPS